MPLLKQANAEPIPGYRLIEPLGSGGFGEVWKCTAPGDLVKAIKFLYGNLNALDFSGVRAEQEFRALQRVKEVRHPFILSIERIESIDGELVIVMELAERNLYDVFVEYQKQGLPGVPRGELLAYLEDAAEALDYMIEQKQIQHLDIKPRNLFWIGHHVKVGDFGLVKDLEGRTEVSPASGAPLGGVTPLYASPETFNGIISKHSDQYSLAIVYQELLTGTRPFNGKTPRQLMLQHVNEQPDLRALPEHERPILAKAMAKKPQERFPDCRSFVRALMAGQLPASPAVPAVASGGGTGAWRAWNMPISFDELTLPGSDSGQPLQGLQDSGGNSDSPSPAHIPPEELTRLSVTVAQPNTGSLRPTLVIGLGRFGKLAIHALRCRVVDRFGSLNKLPLIKYLILDTDEECLRQAMLGPPEQALNPTELHPLPVPPSNVIRRNRAEFDQLVDWMPQEKIYAVPRSLETNGSRAVGRMAFYFNHNRLSARLRSDLKLLADPKNLDQSIETGLGIRSEQPQVYVVASASGGTGSGMLVDLGYNLKKILTELGYKNPEVVGFLMAGAPGDPATPPAEQANLYATLTEIAHYSDPSVEFSALYAGMSTPLRDKGSPFHSVYVTRMGHRSPDGLREAAARIAGYVFHDLTTPLGGRLAQSRLAQRAEQDTPFRTFGSYTVWFPRGLLLRVAARSACNRLLGWWQKSDDDPEWLRIIHDVCDRRLADPRWRPEVIRQRIEEVATTAADGTPSQALTAFLVGLEAQSNQVVVQSDPIGWCRQAMESVRAWVGSGISVAEDTSEWRKSRLHRLFNHALQKIADEYEEYLALPARQMIDKPSYRVAAAEAAYDYFLQRCQENIEAQNAVLREQRRLTDKCWQQVDQAVDTCMQSGSFFLFGASRLRKLLRAFMDRLAAYARQRLVEESCRSVQAFYEALQGRLKHLQHDLSFSRARLRHLEQTLSGDTPPEDIGDWAFGVTGIPNGAATNGRGAEQHVSIAQAYSSHLLREASAMLASRVILPEGASDLEAAAQQFIDGLTTQQWDQLDEYLQEHVLNRNGNLHQICATNRDLVRPLGLPLLEGATEFLGKLLPVTDVCEAEYSAAAVQDIDLSAQLRAYHHLATPSLNSRKPDREYSFLLLPSSDAGKQLGKIARDAIKKVHVIQVSNQTDLLVCREQAELTLEDLHDMLEPCRPAYLTASTTPLTTPHNRCDVHDWIPLDVVNAAAFNAATPSPSRLPFKVAAG